MPDPSNSKLRVLVIDDDKSIRSTLSVCLEGFGYDVLAVATGELARGAIARHSFDLAFTDLRLGSESGLDLIPGLLAIRPNLSIVVITAYATFDTAVQAVQRGAQGYLPKPFSPRRFGTPSMMSCSGAHCSVVSLTSKIGLPRRRPR